MIETCELKGGEITVDMSTVLKQSFCDNCERCISSYNHFNIVKRKCRGNSIKLSSKSDNMRKCFQPDSITLR